MFTIVALCMFGFPIALLGAITLAAFPFWRVTIPNILIFVFGGFIGMSLVVNLATMAAQYVMAVAQIRRELPYGTTLGWASAILGAELGGIALVSLKTAIMHKTRSSDRGQPGSKCHD